MTARRLLKRTLLTFCVVLVSPWILLARLEAAVSSGESLFATGGSFLSLVPGLLGSYLRLAYYACTLQKCSLDVGFGFGALVSHRATEIGTDVTIGGYAAIGTASIGDHVLISPRASILSGRRQHDAWDATQPVTGTKPVFQRVHIGANSWIGEGAIVMADVGERCLVAAGAVLFRPAPAGRMVMGNPARVISRDFSPRPAPPTVPVESDP